MTKTAAIETPPSRKGLSVNLIVAVGVALALVLVGLGMALYNEGQVRAQRLRDMTVQGRILGGSVAAALAFDDRDTTREYVDAERANPQIEAVVYGGAGQLAAGYAKAGAPPPKANLVRGGVFQNDRVIVTLPVQQGRAVLGSVYLRTIAEPLARRLMRYGGIALLLLMAAFLVGGLGVANGSLLDAQRRLRREMEERHKTEEALRRSQELEAKAQLEIATERGRAALRRTEEHLDFSLRSGELGSWTRDLKSGEFTASDLFRAHFGLQADELVTDQLQFIEHIHPDDREPHHQRVRAAIKDHAVLESECRTISDAGDMRWVMVRGRAEYDDEGVATRMAGVSMDISARKAADEDRERLIGELTASNEEMGHFAHSASHDLREPLRMVAAFCRLLSEGYQERLDDRGREYIALAVAGSLQMQALLDDLVEYGRLGLEAERNAWFDSSEALDRALENLHEAMISSGAEVTRGALPKLYGNPIRFIRLMQNLVGNALKYVAKDVKPLVHVDAREEGGEWRFSVVDNGIGIDPRHFKLIFEPFKRLHAKSSYQGTGLGLAICRKIVQGFGGDLWVQSALSEGSTFEFTVKIHEHEQEEEEAAA